jgi:HK97 family phage major capsid protein
MADKTQEILNKLGDFKKDLDHSKNTAECAKQVAEKGEETMKAQYADLNQKIAEIAQVAKMVGETQTKTERELMTEVGRDLVIGCIKGGTFKNDKKAEAITKGLTITNGADGGYGIREEVLRTLRSCQERYGVIRGAVNPIPMRTNTLTWVEQAEDEHPNVTTAVAEGCANPSPNANNTPQLIELRGLHAVVWYHIQRHHL